MTKSKVLISLFLVIVLLASAPAPAYAWKFAHVSDTQTKYDINQKVLAALKYVVPSRIAFVMTGDITAQGTTVQWENWKKILTGTYSSIDSGILPTNWWTSYSTTPPEYFSPAAWHDRGGGGQTPEAEWKANWVNYLPAQVGLSAYPTDVNGNSLRGDSGGRYGSTKYDNTLWIWLDDDNTNFPPGLVDFMIRTLERAAQDPQIIWKFVLHHKPSVTCGGGHGDWSTGIGWNDNYFTQYGVDFVITGHNHYYTRSCPIQSAGSKTCDSRFRGNTINGDPNGPIHITAGGGGGNFYTLNCTSSCSQCSWLEKGKGQVRHFLEFDINGGTLKMNMWEVDTSKSHPYLASGSPYDTLTFIKGPPGTSTPVPTTTPGAQCNRGDGDGDGDVDLNDYFYFWLNFGKNLSGPQNGDFDCDNDIDLNDYFWWWQNFGT